MGRAAFYCFLPLPHNFFFFSLCTFYFGNSVLHCAAKDLEGTEHCCSGVHGYGTCTYVQYKVLVMLRQTRQCSLTNTTNTAVEVQVGQGRRVNGQSVCTCTSMTSSNLCCSKRIGQFRKGQEQNDNDWELAASIAGNGQSTGSPSGSRRSGQRRLIQVMLYNYEVYEIMTRETNRAMDWTPSHPGITGITGITGIILVSSIINTRSITW